MIKQMGIYTNDGILLHIIRQSAIDTHLKTWMDLQSIMLSQKPIANDFYSLPLFIIFPEWQKYRNGEKISVWVGLKREER